MVGGEFICTSSSPSTPKVPIDALILIKLFEHHGVFIGMLLGIIADVHSNAIALKAVLSAMLSRGVELILHAGDIIGYNPYPNQTVELFRNYGIISILGNHDRALISKDTSTFNPYAAAALEWTTHTISSQNFNYISELRNTENFRFQEIKITVVHGSPRHMDEYVYPENAVPELLSYVDADVLVMGHTHFQFMKKYPEGMILNPGSVGQPRDANPDSGFAIMDTCSGKLELHRIPYDVEKVMHDIHEAHLPEQLAFRLQIGF